MNDIEFGPPPELPLNRRQIGHPYAYKKSVSEIPYVVYANRVMERFYVHTDMGQLTHVQPGIVGYVDHIPKSNGDPGMYPIGKSPSRGAACTQHSPNHGQILYKIDPP